jgi:hypothetical protein
VLRRTLCLLILVLASNVQAEPYRLIVLPDTQFNSEKWPQQLTTMTEWVARNAKPLNIKYVLHVGDMVNVGHDEQQWNNFDASMQILDGKVPYVLAVGNHDFDKIAGARSTVLFDRHFPPDRFRRLPQYATQEADRGQQLPHVFGRRNQMADRGDAVPADRRSVARCESRRKGAHGPSRDCAHAFVSDTHRP